MNAAEVLRTWIPQTTGLDAGLLGDGRIEHALAVVMARAGVFSADECVGRILAGRPERDSLVEELVIPETWFFRDRDPFLFLMKRAAEDWVAEGAAGGKPAGKAAPEGKGMLRVLSAPCSTGEEAYSAAIMLLEAGVPAARIQVDAVDISGRALETARRAVYGRRSFREELESTVRRHFVPVADGLRLDGNVVRLVRFHRGNVLERLPEAIKPGYDVVFCRNLLIYLSTEARQKVAEAAWSWLRPGGILFAGHAEVGLFQSFGFVPLEPARCFACRRPLAEEVRGQGAGAGKAAGKAGKPVARRGRESAAAGKAPVGGVPAGAPADGRGATKPAAEPGAPLSIEGIRALANAGIAEEARLLCERYLRENRTDADAHHLMGVIHQAASRAEAAESSFRRALYLEPEHYETLVHLSLLCEGKGESARADVLRARARRVFEGRKAAEARRG